MVGRGEDAYPRGGQGERAGTRRDRAGAGIYTVGEGHAARRAAGEGSLRCDGEARAERLAGQGICRSGGAECGFRGGEEGNAGAARGRRAAGVAGLVDRGASANRSDYRAALRHLADGNLVYRRADGGHRGRRRTGRAGKRHVRVAEAGHRLAEGGSKEDRGISTGVSLTGGPFERNGRGNAVRGELEGVEAVLPYPSESKAAPAGIATLINPSLLGTIWME